MSLEDLKEYCLSFAGAMESYPFDKKILVFSVGGKIFCATNIETFESINVKCLPEHALLLREQFDEVVPGRFMNKKHWNSIILSGKISRNLLKTWISDSYQLVINGLPKKTRDCLVN